MKKTTITTALLLTLFVGFGQAKKDTAALTDSTKFISLSDLSRASFGLQEKNNYRDYTAYLKILNEMVGTLINEYNDKHKPKK